MILLAFVGVVIIGSAKPAVQTNARVGQGMKLLGLGCSLTMSFCYSLISVLTRKMQKIHYSVVLFYYGVFSVVTLTVALVIESFVKDEPLRFIRMSWMQLAVINVASGFNCVGIVSHTIATQNEKSGFITSIAYVSLIYAFCGDLFIFEQIFSV